VSRNRTMMRGRLAELTEQRDRVTRKAKALCEQVLPIINPALFDVAEMDIPGAAAIMDELVMEQAKILNLGAKIEELEKALYD